jgi:cell division protein FtsA
VEKGEEVDLSKLDPAEDQATTRAYVVEIIEARLEEIFDHVNKELKKINRDGKLPAGIVLTGGGSKLPGVVDFAKKHLRLPVTLGKPLGLNTIIGRVEDPSFAAASGLVLWGSRFTAPFSKSQVGKAFKQALSKPGVQKLQKWLKSFLP